MVLRSNPMAEKECNICGHKIQHHYLKPNGKPFWGWEDKRGKKKRWCACKECEEWDAIHGSGFIRRA